MSNTIGTNNFANQACPVCGEFDGKHLADNKGKCPVAERDDAFRIAIAGMVEDLVDQALRTGSKQPEWPIIVWHIKNFAGAFADVVETDPRVVALVAAAREILRRPGTHKPERCPAGPTNSTRCSQCDLRNALQKFEK